MAFPDLNRPFWLFTDASNYAVGAVLSQRSDTKEHVISYTSHVLSQAERKWSTFDRELYAIVWAVRNFRHYLAFHPFNIVTDHKPLVGLKRMPLDHNPTGRRARWAMELDVYDWCIVHRDGARHLNADAMSRHPDGNPMEPTLQRKTFTVSAPSQTQPVNADMQAPSCVVHPASPSAIAGEVGYVGRYHDKVNLVELNSSAWDLKEQQRLD